MDNEKDKGSKPVEKVRSLHDEVVKDFLSENEVAKSFFKEYLPAEITKNLDFDTLKISKDTFVDQELSKHFSDLLYSIKLTDEAAFIYLLIEHKSKEDYFTGFQLLKYMVKIWELHLKQNKKVEALPVILPIVIYHGSKEWRIDTNFISLINAPEYVKNYIPDFDYNLYDISHLPDEEIKGEILLRILLKTLKYIFKPELSHKLPEIFRLFLELKDKKKGTEYLEVLLRYLASSARNLEERELRESFSQTFIEGGDFMPTIAEGWVAQGMEQAKLDVVRSSLKEGLPVKTIAKITGLPVDKINQLKDKMAKEEKASAQMH